MWKNSIFLCLLFNCNNQIFGEQNDVGKFRSTIDNQLLSVELFKEEPFHPIKATKRNHLSESSTLLKVVPIKVNHSENETENDFAFEDQCKVEETIMRIAKNLDEILTEPEPNSTDVWEGRGKRRRKYKKSEVQFLVKSLMGLKVALLGIILPLGVIIAKVLSWKAVTLSLMAFMLAKIVFVKNLFMGKSTTPTQPAQPAQPPIVIHSSSPPHDHVWKRQSEPQIHVKPEVHVHQSEEQFHGWEDSYNNRNWQWGMGRSDNGNHELVYRNWLSQKR